jgi:hypothetical protein
MDWQINRKLMNPLKTLGIVGLIFFVLAFECGDETPSDPETDTDGGRQTTTTGGGSCSTEEEFKAVLTKSFSQYFNERDGKFKETEVEFQTFEVGERFHYQKTFPDIIDAESAYPVRASFVKRDYLNETINPTIYEERVRDYKYVFFTDHHGDCIFRTEGGGTGETKHIPYNP